LGWEGGVAKEGGAGVRKKISVCPPLASVGRCMLVLACGGAVLHPPPSAPPPTPHMIEGFTVIWAGRLGWDGGAAKEGGRRG
jgi:hypothetical protein